jgi:hypothetical protein
MTCADAASIGFMEGPRLMQQVLGLGSEGPRLMQQAVEFRERGLRRGPG